MTQFKYTLYENSSLVKQKGMFFLYQLCKYSNEETLVNCQIICLVFVPETSCLKIFISVNCSWLSTNLFMFLFFYFLRIDSKDNWDRMNEETNLPKIRILASCVNFWLWKLESSKCFCQNAFQRIGSISSVTSKQFDFKIQLNLINCLPLRYKNYCFF
jgi:hypothetical protein